jgi:hypothetical protein
MTVTPSTEQSMVLPAPSFLIIQKTLRSAAIMSMVPVIAAPPAVRTST